MQEENTKQDELIDVGEENEKSIEVNLDEQQPKEEAAKEEKVEVEQVEAKEEKPVEEKKDELKEYSEGVQKRIAKLTRKMREAERQKEEALTFAQAIKRDKDLLEGKLSKLDKSYVSEFENRVKTNMDAARQALKVAIEAGDVEGQVSAQEQMARLSSDAVRLGQLKAAEEMQPQKKVNITPQQRSYDPTTNVPTDAKAEEWASNNSWFGNDSAMTYTAFDIHKKIVEDRDWETLVVGS
jgi:chromosome segregation ATPase